MTTTIQRTGKGLKAANLIALASIFGSLLMIEKDPDAAAWVFVLGIIAFLIVRVLIWWNHD